MSIDAMEPGLPGKKAEGQPVYDFLLIDDDADTLLLTGECLRAENFSVLTAQNASRAMQQLENKVRLIVLDLNLDGEDGLQLLDFIKMNHPEIPIIIYTGLPHESRQVTAMLQRGATCYVHKGMTINQKAIQDLTFAIKIIRAGSKNAKS